jgi:hypothetical protein
MAYALILAFLISAPAFALGKKPSNPEPPVPPKPPVEESTGATYRQRYALKDATQKLVDNKGNGHENLYGVRNFRAVLNGIYYRGGANNAYHRTNKRGNENPLPNDGLQNLCEEGFGTAVYLYATNYATAPKSVKCRAFDGTENTLEYKQVSVLSGTSQVKQILSVIYDHIRNPRLGPVYMHCWNGWHASGFAGAAALRQFCGFTADQAVSYWNKNIDGVEVGESVRNKIRAFQPFSDFSLTAAEKKAFCPDPSSLKF